METQAEAVAVEAAAEVTDAEAEELKRQLEAVTAEKVALASQKDALLLERETLREAMVDAREEFESTLAVERDVMASRISSILVESEANQASIAKQGRDEKTAAETAWLTERAALLQEWRTDPMPFRASSGRCLRN
jgi:hypothetical protein